MIFKKNDNASDMPLLIPIEISSKLRPVGSDITQCLPPHSKKTRVVTYEFFLLYLLYINYSSSYYIMKQIY